MTASNLMHRTLVLHTTKLAYDQAFEKHDPNRCNCLRTDGLPASLPYCERLPASFSVQLVQCATHSV